MSLKEILKHTFVYYWYRSFMNSTKNWRIGFNWLIIRFFLCFPSKHVRILFLNLMGADIHKSVPIYRGFQWRKGTPFVIGEGTSVGLFNMFDSRRGLIIGKNVCFSDHVTIWTLHHDYNDIHFCSKGAPVHIGDYVWVGCNVIILPGVSIGEGAILASGCVVTKDVEPYTVVGGIPAKKIAEREKKHYNYCPADFWVHMD